MLKVRRTPLGFEVEQFSIGPFIYIDQWLWADLASNELLRDRAIAVFQSVRPTIMYSDITYLEMLKIKDSQQLDNLSRVMDSADFMLIVSNPFAALREERINPGTSANVVNLHAIADNALIRAVLKDLEGKEYSSITGSTVLDVARMPKNRDVIRKYCAGYADALNPIIKQARGKAIFQKRIKERARSLAPAGSHLSCTSIVYQRAIDFIVMNRSMEMPESEWLDVMHTVVPVSYADYVALDKRWHHFISYDSPISKCRTAKVYWKGTLDNFFMDIQSHHSLVPLSHRTTAQA